MDEEMIEIRKNARRHIRISALLESSLLRRYLRRHGLLIIRTC